MNVSFQSHKLGYLERNSNYRAFKNELYTVPGPNKKVYILPLWIITVNVLIDIFCIGLVSYRREHPKQGDGSSIYLIQVVIWLWGFSELKKNKNLLPKQWTKYNSFQIFKCEKQISILSSRNKFALANRTVWVKKKILFTMLR